MSSLADEEGLIDSIVDAMHRPIVEEVHADKHKKTVAIHTYGEPTVFKEFDIAPAPQSHTAQSVQGLLTYLNNPSIDPERGIVFVGLNEVVAVPHYGTTRTDRAVVTLTHSPEYAALQKIIAGVDQKKLYELLSTALCDGIIDDALAADIASIAISRDEKESLQIRNAGQERSTGGGWRVTFAGDDGASKTQTVKKTWLFEGRIFEALETRYKIELVLMIDGDAKPVKFSFYPKRLEDVLRQARADVRAAIEDGIDGADASDADRQEIQELLAQSGAKGPKDMAAVLLPQPRWTVIEASA